MHTHTQFSRDSRTSLEAFARRAAEAGLGAVCVTDHDTAAGGLRLAALDPPFRVIPGEEGTTRDGELIGLYLRRDVPPRLPAEERTLARSTSEAVVHLRTWADVARKLARRTVWTLTSGTTPPRRP